MTTYREFQQELERLHQEAETARRREKSAALEKIRSLIVEYRLLPSDLGFPTAKPKTVGAAKYRDPATGRTWSGKGRAPQWIVGQVRAEMEIK